MDIINKFKVINLLILSGVIAMPYDIAMATEVYNTSEEDLIKLLEKHKNEKITLEDGLVLTIGESVNLPIAEGWTSYT